MEELTKTELENKIKKWWNITGIVMASAMGLTLIVLFLALANWMKNQPPPPIVIEAPYKSVYRDHIHYLQFKNGTVVNYTEDSMNYADRTSYDEDTTVVKIVPQKAPKVKQTSYDPDAGRILYPESWKEDRMPSEDRLIILGGDTIEGKKDTTKIKTKQP